MKFDDNLQERYNLKYENKQRNEKFNVYRTRKYKEEWNINYGTFRTRTLGDWKKRRKHLQTLVDGGHGEIKSCKRVIPTLESTEKKPYFDSECMKDPTTKKDPNIKNRKHPRTKKTKQPPTKRTKLFRSPSKKVDILKFDDNLQERYNLKYENKQSNENFNAYRTRKYKEEWKINYGTFRTRTLADWKKRRKYLRTLVDGGHGEIKSCKRVIPTLEST